MFTITSSQTRPVSYQISSSIKLPDSYSYFYLNNIVEEDQNSNVTEITLFSNLKQYYSGTEYLVFYFKNLSTTLQNVENEIKNNLSILNFDPRASINYFYSSTDNESIFYIRSYVLDNFVRYLYSYPYTLQFNFTFDNFNAIIFAKTMTSSLSVNYPYSLDISYVMCKK